MSFADRLAVLTDAQRNQLELLLMEFDQSWDPTLLTEYCERVAAEKDSHYGKLAVSELVKIDLERRWSNGDGLLLEDYCERIPLLGGAESLNSDVILVEYQARRAVDSALTLDGYAHRFPAHFEQLASMAVEVMEPDGAVNPRSGSDESAHASIETSRAADARDTAQLKQARQKVLPGEFGRYRILGELGSGAMGTVYLAHDSKLDRKVAIKTPDIEGGQGDELVIRFYREARAAGKVHHRNICPIYDVGEIDGRHFISMAFIEGRSMAELLKSAKMPSPTSCAIIVHRLACALAEAHQHSVVHRDLKPANIMIDTKQEPVVMDFGLACQTDVESRMTQSGTMVGTPAYMSPEQLSGDPSDVGPLADIYSLGVILYELLTGRLPFRGAIAQVMYQIVHEEPLAPSQIRSEVDPELDAIVAKMMDKDCDTRFQTMDEVATALEQYLNINNATDLTQSRKAESSPLSSIAEEIVAENPLAEPRRSSGPFRDKRTWISTGLVGGFVLVVVISFLVRTPYGTIRVETFGDLDGLEVLVDGDTINLTTPKKAAAREHELALKLGGVYLVLDPDTRHFYVKQNGAARRLTVSIGDLRLSTTTFTVTRNRETILTIELVKTEITSPPFAVAPFDTATARRHQGAWAQYLGVDVMKVVELPGGTSMTMMLVPPGEFLMGSAKTEQKQFLEEQVRLFADTEKPKYRRAIDRIPAEGPQHRVRISRPFYLGMYEVTQAQWQAVMGSNPSDFKAPEKPVEHVRWIDIQRFLRNLSLASQQQWMEFVLPTEAQWEYACRAGTTTLWNCGDTALQEHAWFAANSSLETHLVGKLKSNAWGLYDMHGNVREWCADLYNEEYYGQAPMSDPCAATSPNDKYRGYHVLRGGDFGDSPGLCRSAHRSGGSRDYLSPVRGFRLAMSINAAKLSNAAADESAEAKPGVEGKNGNDH